MVATNIKVFKFGGASVKSAEGVKNLASIVKRYPGNLVVVVSAMGKTTNALERILNGYLEGGSHFMVEYEKLKEFHLGIAAELIADRGNILYAKLDSLFGQLEAILEAKLTGSYDYCYDQIVSFGELISTVIVSSYLEHVGISNQWVDVRTCLKSDTTYREGAIDYITSRFLTQKTFNFGTERVYITQGFIAGTQAGTTTTLGREGSDYTAAILANLLDALDVTIWKDVEGVLNADPKIFPNTVKLDFVSFQEAIELAFCGAQIIHPKTIKPLQNKQIPLFVKSFLNPDGVGTKILQSDQPLQLPPVFILRRNQVLMSLTPRDFSFVIEDSLSKIFALLYKHRVKVNLVQNSAISFTVCVDEEKQYLPAAIEELKNDFKVRYNNNLELVTIRHYTPQAIDSEISGRQVYLQQRTRSTARFVMDARG